MVAEALAADEPSVIALGGGAVTVQDDARAARAARVHRLGRDRRRPRLGASARRQASAGAGRGVVPCALRAARRPLSGDVRRRRRERRRRAARSLQVAAEPGLLADLDWLVDGRPSALVADERVLALHDPGLDGERHPVPSGETAKRLEVVAPLWDELGIGRDGVLVAFGGGTTTDLAGFVAATLPARHPVDRGADDAWSARWTRRSAARPGSTWRSARTWRARSISRSRS